MIHDKPFQFSEQLRRTIFLPRPNYFNANDLNKELLTIHKFVEEFNKKFAIVSELSITFNTYGESGFVENNVPMIERAFHFSWDAKPILYNGVEFQITAGGMSYSHKYPKPDDTTSPRGVKPPTYIVLKAELQELTFAHNTALCGLTSDETPNAVPSVNVEQYHNVTIDVSKELDEVNIICILGIIHPNYDENGTETQHGFIKCTFHNPEITKENGLDRVQSNMKSNGTLFEYISEKFLSRISKLLNERQLIRRFHLSDLISPELARYNLGLSNLVNHRQLVRDENLKDIADPVKARFNLGLKGGATREVGPNATDLAPGNIMPIGAIIMWSGVPSTIPAGWELCDGTNGTPNLSGRFVVGYSPADTEFSPVGAIGGIKEFTITKNNLPDYELPTTQQPHNHDLPASPHRGEAGSGWFQTNGEGGVWYGSQNKTIDIKIRLGGSSQSIKSLPPYYALCYIMYVGGAGVTTNTPTPTQTTLNYPNYSEPNSSTDGGYSSSGYGLASSQQTIGAGIILTNPS